MIKTNGEKDLVIPVSESFWPTFITSKLVVRPVKHSWCFCLSDENDAKQLILVFPAEDSTDLPLPQELASVFKLGKKGQPFFEVRSLPIPLQKMMSISGVYLEQVFLDDREMIVLYASREPIGEIAFADSMLASFHLTTTESGEQHWPRSADDMYVLFHEFFRFFSTINVFALVRCGAEVVSTPRATIVAALQAKGATGYQLAAEQSESPLPI